MSVIGSNVLAGASGQAAGGAGGFAISRSLRFNSGDSAYLGKTFGSGGNSKTWTLSFWVKRAGLSATNCLFMSYNGSSIAEGNYATIEFSSNDSFRVGYAYASYKTTTRVFRDPSAWYHIVVVIDTTNSTAGDRVQIYVNGVKETSFSATHDPDLNQDLAWNKSSFIHRLGSEYNAQYCNIYLADVHFIDGQALAPTDFGETNTDNLWVPKAFAADPEQVQSSPTTYVSSSSVTDPTNAFDGSSGTKATYSGVNSWISFTVDDASRLAVPFEIRNDSSATAQTVAMFTDSSGSSAAGGSWTSTSNNNLSPAVSTTVLDTYTFPSTGTYYLRHTAGSSNNIFAYKIGGPVTTGGIGTNGFHLDFADNSSNAALGTDTSGNSNTWTVNNLTAALPKESANWLAMATGTPYNSSTALANAFDGNASTQAAPGQGNTMSFTPSPAITGITKIRIKGRRDANQTDVNNFTLNGTVIGGSWSAGSTATVEFTTLGGSAITQLTNLSWSAMSSSNEWFGVYTIEIYYDGSYKTLVTDTGAAASVDSLVDTPTNGTQADTGAGGEVVGNYATLNPLDITTTTTTFSNGNLDITSTGQSKALASFTPSSGKWYLEVTLGSIVTNSWIGLYGTASSSSAACLYGINGYGFYSTGFGSITHTVSGSGSTGDVIGVALDIDAKTLEYYKNGVSLGTFSNIVFPSSWAIGMNCNATLTSAWSFNFGQRAFAYAAPSGYKALNTASLPQPTIADGSQYFDTKLWTGTGSTLALTMANSALSPDFVWIKNRSSTYQHLLFDAVRGATKYLKSDATSAEQTNGSTLASFDSNGFTLGGDNEINRSSYTYASWNWDAGSSTVSNTDGSITSQVRANPSAGFSIVKWTGTGSSSTVGHGLSAAPAFIILKNLTDAQNWYVYSASLGAGKTLSLNIADAAYSDVGMWGGVEPTSSVFTANSYALNNRDYIAYCFAPVEGYSAMGSYTGNGSADGPFVYTGFKPAFVMIKNISAGSNWIILDNARDPINDASKRLSPNLSNAEDPSSTLDFTSTGFKIRRDGQTENINGNTYVYIAFASHPFASNGGLAR